MTSRCKSCGEEIIWMKTDAGKNIPVDAETVADTGATIFDPEQMISHFATCKDANTWRKKK
jgi:hypothetical protein